MPMRKMRPAAQTHASVETSTTTTPSAGCHHGMPGGAAMRATISIGVAGGKNDIAVAKVLVGSRMTLSQTNSGIIVTSVTGVSIACASLRSVQAAPTAA